MVVHLVNNNARLDMCLETIEKGDILILSGPAVTEAVAPGFLLQGIDWRALSEDLKVRGLDQRIPEGRQIDIAGMTSCMLLADKQVAW